MSWNIECDFQLLYESNSTNFTCDELRIYCDAYREWILTEYYIGQTINVGLLVGGLAGMISYILMIIVFQVPDFKGASYIYHKSICYMELAHMFVMAQSGLERFLPIDKSAYSYVFYIKIVRELWLLGDAMKLSTSMVTSFLSLERFIAIWFPNGFATFNQPRIAWAFVAISFLFGLLSFSPAFTARMVEQRTNENRSVWTTISIGGGQGSNVGGDEVVTDIIYAAKGITSVLMIFCCIGVALGLIIKSKKASSMTSNARTKWQENRRLSILQIVIAMLQIVDHVMWVVSNVITDQPPPNMYLGSEAIAELSYAEAMAVLEYKSFWRWTLAGQEVTGILDHAARLPLYLVGMKKFREGFAALFRRKGAKVHHENIAMSPDQGDQQKVAVIREVDRVNSGF